MKVYKMTLMFIDFDNVGMTDAKQLIENARLPNHINPGTVVAIEERDIGEWHDDHPLNNRKTQIAALQLLFKGPDLGAYQHLVNEMLTFIRQGMTGHLGMRKEGQHMYAEVDLSVLEAWERRMKIIEDKT
jgi:hypothetical protein